MIVDFLYLSYILDAAIFETNFLSLFNANLSLRNYFLKFNRTACLRGAPTKFLFFCNKSVEIWDFRFQNLETW